VGRAVFFSGGIVVLHAMAERSRPAGRQTLAHHHTHRPARLRQYHAGRTGGTARRPAPAAALLAFLRPSDALVVDEYWRVSPAALCWQRGRTGLSVLASSHAGTA